MTSGGPETFAADADLPSVMGQLEAKACSVDVVLLDGGSRRGWGSPGCLQRLGLLSRHPNSV